MSRRKIDRALSVANPIDADQAEALDLDRGEQELLSGIVAEPEGREVAARAARAGGRWRGRTVTRLLTAATAGACAVLALFVFNGGGGSPGKPESAYASELARIAKHAKVVVVEPAATAGRERSPQAGGWTEIQTIWDCRELPCVKKTAAEMGGAGFAASEVKTSPGGEVAIVIPPAGGD